MSEQIERLEHERNGAVTPGPLQHVAELAAGRLFEPLLGNGGPAHVTAEVLETSPVTRGHGDVGMHIEPAALANALGLSCTGRVDDTQQRLAARSPVWYALAPLIRYTAMPPKSAGVPQRRAGMRGITASTNFWPKPVEPRGFGRTTTYPCAAQSCGFQR